MIEYIDSHCHLDLVAEKEIQRARSMGVKGFVIPGISGADPRAIELSEKYKDVFFAVGVHPLFISEADEQTGKTLEYMLFHKKCAALGETGLDYYTGRENRDNQIQNFITHLKLAQKTGAPVIIHLRKGFDDFLSIVSDFADVTLIMHMYSGSRETTDVLLDRMNTVFFSFGGPHTREHSKKNDRLIRSMPSERILIETDSPDLPPPGFNTPNTPANLPYIAEKIAEKRGDSVERFSQQLIENTRRAFSWKNAFQD